MRNLAEPEETATTKSQTGKTTKTRNYPSDLTIVIDTREQLPYTWPDVPTKRAALSTGDYSLAGYESVVCIERKSLDDFVGSIGQGHDRFYAELRRMAFYRRCLLMIEGSQRQIDDHQYKSMMTPTQVNAQLRAILCDYQIPFWLAGGREAAKQLTLDQLRKWHKWLTHA
jgi:ERCC4-type nuclease